MTPQRQMILLAVAATAVILCFLLFGYAQNMYATPSPSPSPSASASATTDEDEEPDPDATATPSTGPLTFHGHNCSPDCGDLEAGYTYGQQNEVQSQTGCETDQGSSQFREGCQIYVDEQASGESP